MKTYPEVLLPTVKFKYIDCDISDYDLIRHFDVVDNTPIHNELDEIDVQYICHPSAQINDLSMSLLGIFKPTHTQISLTRQGKEVFGIECLPDFDGLPPTYQTDFIIDGKRCYWVIQCEFINEMKVVINIDNKDVEVISYIVHTPMKWNFWHYSIRWQIGNEDLHSINKYSKNQLKNIFSKIGAKARSNIIHLATTIAEVYPIIGKACYSNNN